MPSKQRILSLALLLLSPFAKAQPALSPYADLSLNVHWDNQTASLEPFDWASQASKQSIKGFRLAFVTDAGQCQPAWGGIPSYGFEQPFAKKLSRNLARQNITTSLSFGGASGNDLSLHCSEADLVQIFNHALNLYSVKALDFDIENGSTNVPKLMRALQIFQEKNPNIPISFTLPTLPEGLTWQGKEVVNEAQQAGLNFSVNIMAMDYGPAYTANMGQYAIQAANSLQSYLKTLYPKATETALWQRIQVTPMIGVNDINTEQFSLNDARTLAKFAKEKDMALSMWSINRDQPCQDSYASPICSGNHLQQKPFEFFMNLS